MVNAEERVRLFDIQEIDNGNRYSGRRKKRESDREKERERIR